MEIGPIMYYTRRGDVKVQEIAGEVLILDQQGGHVHQLNQTANFIWHQCDGATSVAKIVDRVVEQFDVEMAVATRDVAQVIGQLRDLQLIRQ